MSGGLIIDFIESQTDRYEVQTAEQLTRRTALHYISTGTQAKYNKQQSLAQANKLLNTNGAKRLRTTAPGLYPVSIHQMAPPA